MANTKSYGVLGLFVLGFILFLVVVGGHVTTQLKIHKQEMECVKTMINYGHARSTIQFKNGTCSIKPLQ